MSFRTPKRRPWLGWGWIAWFGFVGLIALGFLGLAAWALITLVNHFTA